MWWLVYTLIKNRKRTQYMDKRNAGNLQGTILKTKCSITKGNFLKIKCCLFRVQQLTSTNLVGYFGRLWNGRLLYVTIHTLNGSLCHCSLSYVRLSPKQLKVETKRLYCSWSKSIQSFETKFYSSTGLEDTQGNES